MVESQDNIYLQLFEISIPHKKEIKLPTIYVDTSK